MAVLETIRVKLGVLITVLIAVALLSFIIDPSTLQSVSSSMSSKYDVGNIDGKAVSYQDFQAEVDRFTTISEVTSGTSAKSEQEQEAIRDAAWQSLIDQYLFIRNAQAAGIKVGEEEMSGIISGDIFSNVISNNPTFFDENGVFSKEMLLNFVDYVNSDNSGRLKVYWDYLQNQMSVRQYYSKYLSLFTQSNFTNPLMLSEQIAENNNTFNVEFVMVPFGYAKDTTIVVSSDEIKQYYNAHKKFYKQKASRDIEYVVFEVKPSDKDIEDASNSLLKVYDEFASAANIKSFLLANSDRPYDNSWFKPGELNRISKVVNDYAFGNNASVSGMLEDGDTFYAVRVMEEAMVPDSVFVKYVPAASENVDSLLALAEPQWIPQTPGYEDVMTVMPRRRATVNGLVFEVLDRTAPVAKKRVAVLEKGTVPGKETINSYYSQANTFATKAAGNYDNFRNAVSELGLYAHPVNKMLEGADRLGAIDDTKEVARWAFDAKKGDVSSIITVNNNYFIVATLTGIHKEGYADLAEVSSSIENILYQKKLAQKKESEIAEQIAGLETMESIAEALNTTVSTKDGVAFSSLTSQGLDPKFIGAASVAEEGRIYGPVAGNIGVYVYKVTGRDTGAFYTEDDAKARDAQMTQYSTQMLVPVMMDDADVKDNRARFY